MKGGKLIIFSAPSGSGKTTIVRHLISVFHDQLAFSISATSRPPRGVEENGKDYYYFSVDKFKKKIENGDFLEWEEVYANTFYGTLKAEVQRIWSEGKSVIFDIDVEGGINLKNLFGDRALGVFVMPPSIKILEERLRVRNTESAESIARRIEKAEKELKTANLFDVFILNENLGSALVEAEKIIGDFLSQ